MWSDLRLFANVYILARDIQNLEMVPLGPMNGKSFATSVSAWVVTSEALSVFGRPAPAREVETAPYLQDPKTENTYNIRLRADLKNPNGNTTTICETEMKNMYWTFRDLIAHQTSNGCNINVGDILASGTISGMTKTSHGCLLELTKGGMEPFKTASGADKMYLDDGDVVSISAYMGEGVGFGECTGKLLASHIPSNPEIVLGS